MAIDGSFNLKSALERFLDRCPKLAACPRFNSLAKEGGMEREKEVVRALAEVFLHPAYTIPLIGCFRPIIQIITEKVVSMLRLVGDLRSNPNHMDDESALDNAVAEGVSVIDFYVRNGRRLELHECACLAFCRALDLNPFLLGSALNYFEFAPPPYERILVDKIVSEVSLKVTLCLHSVRLTYRFLIMEPEVFSKLWDWSCFLDFVRKLSEIDPQSGAKCEDISDIRWCSMQILSMVLKLSERATASCGIGTEEAFSCLLRWEEFCQDVAIEKAGSYVECSSHTKLETVNDWTALNHSIYQRSFGLTLGASRSQELEPSTKSRKLETRGDEDPFVMTSGVKKSFEMVLLAVNQNRPVLLYGTSGSGKSALIRKLAQDSGNKVLSIQMDDQIDGKTLVGTYVCTEQPGEFRWQPGSLTQAVMNGFWVVLEDIDKAPSDVPLVLLPLLEGSSLFPTSHGEVIRVSENFRLFSTVSTSECSISHIREGVNVLGALWRKIMISPPNIEDLQSIVTKWYPHLEPVAEKLIETFENVNSAPLPHFAKSLSRFSLRDLLKWCKRINGLTSLEQRSIYKEAVDIFASSHMSLENRLATVKIIACIWNIPVSDALKLHGDKPTIQDLSGRLKIGRVTLQLAKTLPHDRSKFVEIRSSLCLLESIACCVEYNEPVLLVGETGTGKTTLVQNLASWLGQKLTVLNLSQQSDIVDLLGGFKPVDAQFMCMSLYNDFNKLARKKSGLKDDTKAVQYLQKQLRAKNWEKFLSGLERLIKWVEGKQGENPSRKRKKPDKLKAWAELSMKVGNIRGQIFSGGMVFTFVEGAFVTALKEGAWILLDEVNLAPPEILGRVIGVLEGEKGSLCLAERGDVSGICRHPNFRIFACMNPATDAGKRDLPYSFRSRFTEYFVDDVLDGNDLEIFVRNFLVEHQSDTNLVARIVSFYKEAKKESEEKLQDGANQKPQYSLRSLYRALEYTRKAERISGFQKAIYDGFCMFFLSLLDESSGRIMNRLIVRQLFGEDIPLHHSLSFRSYLGEEVSNLDDFVRKYVITKTVEKHLGNLARAIFIRRYPVLLQGPTSSGKTSLVRYLAAITGHKFVRINNHEHTDLQEYLGSYITDSSGKLVFHEGVLVKAVRNGHWIVLDELNLAPSDVLEALNRLLDDNRELFVPELRETIRAHPDFMLFATQNPPTLYGGRKLLSRAFRNRFVEIHVGEIPEDELSIILTQRCQIPESYARKMVEVMKDLQLHRQSSKVFAGKHGFVTPRDLFRWADRFRAFGKSYEDLARDGYYLLAERLRDDDEKRVVQDVLEKHLRVNLTKDDLYMPELLGVDPGHNLKDDSMQIEGPEGLQKRAISWTKSMQRLYFLIRRCYEMHEPVLLVGETGGGKTTICQLLGDALGLRLHILNCHQYTETSDFLGGFYPIRDRAKLSADYKYIIEQLKTSKVFNCVGKDAAISSEISNAELTVKELDVLIEKYGQGLVSDADITNQEFDAFEQMKHDLAQLHQKWQAIFMWQDGPLVQAMRAGDLFLVDEISLADDSVLERLNSVLEPERKLALAEKGGAVLEEVIAHENFLVLATMNPGGDYGKKELSPALRNRFTEIWVPPITDSDELRSIALHGLSDLQNHEIIIDPIVNFWEWFNRMQIGRTLTVRDLLSWVMFVNVTGERLGPAFAILHGAFLVLLDGLSLGTGISRREGEELRKKCFSFLLEQLKVVGSDISLSELSKMEKYGSDNIDTTAVASNSVLRDNMFGIGHFSIERGNENPESGGFEFLAPTTCRNVLRVLRAMQLPRPVLLEGSPGVGKTSLITALAKYSGHNVVRINLSEQTDMMDLLGSDLPVDSDEGMKFAWSDGILLQALKEGSWVLLDELNLAPQSVLEGLNAILDHRAEVFIPELGLTFKCPSSFRVFACQNPSSQGGGRKGLPKSFLNRFTKVYVDELMEDDYLFICSSLYPSIPRHVLSKLISFNRLLHEETMLHHKFGQDGSPWEFNLRDVIRSCQVIKEADDLKIDCFLNILYVQRMRTVSDRREVLRIYEEVFGQKPSINPYPRVQLNPRYLVVGNTAIKRNCTRSKISGKKLKITPEIRQCLEAAAQCVQNQWLCILVGPSSSGKTSLIRILARLTGNTLNELNLSSATDISELLGCFEQYNAFRKFRMIIAQVECFVDEYCNLLAETFLAEFSSERRDLVCSWLSFLSRIDANLMSSSSFSFMENSKSFDDSLSKLVEIIGQLKQDMEKNVLRVSWSSKDLDQIMKTVLKLRTHEKRPSAKFEWVAGVLIKAIENGEWIVLENANLCNPTVLDRINSLVEPSGTITINECGIVDGKPVIVNPHPNFRMFLTVNPGFGEVSRAMRNRGVEICMMESHWLLDEGLHGKEEFTLRDVKRFLVLSGIPGCKLVDSMAKAHVYARLKSWSLNVRISHLELAQWVQLFQQLLVNGNRFLWSLQISWEHIYLSSIGETDGKEIVHHAKDAYLSAIELSDNNSFLGRGLCLPGGWPKCFNLRDFTQYSREFTVRQNCMYLEFLGAQYASHCSEISHSGCPVNQDLAACLTIDTRRLCEVMFPKYSRESAFCLNEEFNLNLADKMLLYAANWIVEQATENDLQLYIVWFSWLGSRLYPYCQFFDSFVSMLKEELNHPIWNHLVSCRQDLLANDKTDLDMTPIPMLSLELVEVKAQNDASKLSSKHLSDAINSTGVLRLTYLQWHAEMSHQCTEKSWGFLPFLESLHALEEKVLSMLVGSPYFDMLIQLYSQLVEEHSLFWSVLTSSQSEHLMVSFRSLVKAAKRLLNFFPEEVDVVLESTELNKVSSWHFYPERSFLWAYGGHPSLPVSAELYHQQQKLLKLCNSVWPMKLEPQDQVHHHLTEFVAASDPELRSLALQGVCMSSYIIGNYDGDDVTIVQRAEEIYQMLLTRLEREKHKLESEIDSEDHKMFKENSAACCVFLPEMLCKGSGFSSWLETLLVVDSGSCCLDVELLQLLQGLLLILLTETRSSELPQDLTNVSSLLEYALNYSLSSTRPPQTLLAHQKLLWTIDVWTSVDAVSTKISGLVLEMWYWWHSFLWSHSHIPFTDFSKIDGFDISLPSMVIHPVKTAIVDQMLRSSFAIKEYAVQSIKLKSASRNLWKISPSVMEIPTFLLSIARSLFQQIIYTHRKSFDADKFAAIKSILYSCQKRINTMDAIQYLISMIGSSRHQTLKSLMHSFIEPLLKHLYLYCSSNDFYPNLGFAWLHLGGLRFHLLLSSDGLDPAMKNSWKLSQLEEKILSLQLNMEVREECEYLAGWFSAGETNKKMIQALENLKSERKRLQKKVVYRPDPKKFRELIRECDEFLVFVNSSMGLVKNIEIADWHQVVEQVCNWQETAACFIDRLSKEYAEYIDIAQPVQIAVYEMKMGLALVLSGTFLKRILNRIGTDRADLVMDTIYSFMRFPRGFTSESTISLRYSALLQSSLDINSAPKFFDLDVGLLDKLLTISSEKDAGKVSLLQLRAVFYKNLLLRVAYLVANAKLMDNASFELLDRIYNEFARIWTKMKVQIKTKANSDAEQYKFRARAFKIESVMEVDISSLGKYFSNESFSEWQEYLAEEDPNDMSEINQENENLEDEWDLMQEPLNKIISVHNHLFGSFDLLENPGSFHISDTQRLDSFIDSYELGVRMIKGLGGLFTSSVDAKLVPENLLRLCLQHERNFNPSHKPASRFNFYKDSNAPLLAKMAKLLSALQRRVSSLLGEWEEHPGLQKLLDVVQLLLDIPSDTPLAKALSGLQFLLNRARLLHEDGRKFFFADQLDPIAALVSSWHKLEFESWPALLDEVQYQYEINGGKLWYPLFSVLFNDYSADIAEHDQSITQSLVEFIQTSNVGEFKTRLKLLFAFLGQLTMGSSLGTYSSNWHQRNLRICYNIFGFYVQFLPNVIEHVEAKRRNIEDELKELLKLCRWERLESFLSIENTKRTRQKLKKLIQKYTDMLQQPVMLIINQEAPQKGGEQSLQGPKPLNKISDRSIDILNTALDAKQFNEEDRFIWYSSWREKINGAVKGFYCEVPLGTKSFMAEDVATVFAQCVSHQSTIPVYQGGWNNVWHTLARICRTTIGCEDLWRDVNRSIGKKRALSELLKLLENSGLQKHKFENMEISDNSNQLFVQPPYDPLHLLLTKSENSIPRVNSVAEWKAANEFYFKSVASVQLLLQICWKHHEDFTSEQVNRSISFLNHLIVIQQMQRAAAYHFAEQLKRLRTYVLALDTLLVASTDTETRDGVLCSFAQNQHSILNCMWQQKQLIDSLLELLLEESALLRTVDSTHLNSCQDVKAAVIGLSTFIGKFIPIIQKSKESLDSCLLSCNGGIATLSGTLHPYFVSKQIVQLVLQNFEILKEFEDQLSTFRDKDAGKSSALDTLLRHFDDVFKKGKLISEQLKAVLETGNRSANTCEEDMSCLENYSEQSTEFDGTFKRTFGFVMDVVQKLCFSCKDNGTSEELVENITAWEFLFQSAETDLNMDKLCDKLLETISFAEKVVNSSGNNDPALSSHIGEHLKHLHGFLELVLSFGDSYLQDFLVMSKTVSLMAHVLANVLAKLYSKGFGISPKEEEDDTKADKPESATGTGMGEGAGLKDVSDQIEDEDQLLGTSEKDAEQQDIPNEAPSKNDKGIEMENEFDGEAYNVSEDSGEEDNDDEEAEPLDSAMGEAGSDSEVIDEKLWNKDEDENPENKNEKYESGQSVVDKDARSRELRAKEDTSTTADESGEPNSSDKLEEGNDATDNQDDLDDTEKLEDMNLNKDEAFADPTGLKPDEVNENADEGMDLDEKEDGDGKEDADGKEDMDCQKEQCTEEQTESEKIENCEENSNPADENVDAGIEDVCGTPPRDHPSDDLVEHSEMEPTETKNNGLQQSNSDVGSNPVPGVEFGSQPLRESQILEPESTAPEANWSNSKDINSLAAPVDLPSGNNCDMDVMVTDSSSGEKMTNNLPRTGLPQHESSLSQNKPNPYRNVGDALEEWKERVKVSVDLHEDKQDPEGEVEDNNADEFGYVSEFEKGTAQALGPATSEQMDKNVKGKEHESNDSNDHAANRDEATGMDIDKFDSEKQLVTHSAPVIKNSISEKIQIPDSDMSTREDSLTHDFVDADVRMRSESSVSINRSFLSQDINNLSKLSVNDKEMGKVQDLEADPDARNESIVLWRRYELQTTKLSQELAEQLRLIMEPTLASKLQGDYRTGKRINMKKVIPYIASHYRKDKIWLRRTRPNKREYQVVIAVDDSRSMSESSCGDFAIRALVTVCRAMSQLEMGNVAVASFGKKGNIRLLQDFSQSFTMESGIKMISSLTFKQENTIEDEPVVDLLTYLNSMLDAAVAKTRLPSGKSPLQQLVLIIGDGRFHEKERLKHRVRDLLSKKRMVAFLLLDSTEESVLDLKELTMQAGGVKFSKYLDSFPFPYYIVLRDIEALPRTLADLLRQWFELMQNSRD